MFETQPTWMKQNENPVCSIQDIVVQNSHSKIAGCMSNADCSMGIVNVTSWPSNCSNEQTTHVLQNGSFLLNHSGMSDWPNSPLLTTAASTGTGPFQQPPASQPFVSSTNSAKGSHFYGYSTGSMKKVLNLGSVFGNEPAIEDLTMLPQDCETLMQKKIGCSNPDFKSGSNTFLKKKRQRKTITRVKDDKYWERRQRNNLAAKKSRDAKREKEQNIETRLTCLEIENRRLRLELSCLLEQNKKFKLVTGLI